MPPRERRMTETRKLAAILSADVVGYSRLVGADEEGTLARLRALRSDLIDPTIAAHVGRVVKRTGDGILIEFRSVVEAVRCAIGIQTGMAERNAGLAADRRIDFRIGIHVGDVIEENDGDLMGDGVNIAARLEGIAEPGGISLSASAHDQVRGKVNVAFSDSGEQKLKNIERPVRTFRVLLKAPKAKLLSRLPPLRGKRIGLAVLAGALTLLAVGIGAGWRWQARRDGVFEWLRPAELGGAKMAAPSLGRPMVAVLPFSNLSEQSSDDYFGDGLTEDIISALGRFPELGVLSRNAVLPYKARQIRTQDLGRELGARYVVEGTVRRSAEHVRVTAQLADASDGRLLWSTQYDTEPKGIFTIQDDITRHIAGALAVRLTKLEQERSAAKPPNAVEAYDLVLQGRQRMMARDTRAANVEARTLFKHAIDIDPGYAAAYVGLGESYLISALRGWSDQPEETLKRAENLATTAIAVDSSSPGAHSLLGSVEVLFRHYDQAIKELDRAIDLNPSDAETYGWLGNALLFAGNLQRAIDSGETALHFDPNLDVHHLWPLGTAYFLAGRVADATRVMEQIVARNPDYTFAHVILVAAYTKSGRPEDAARAVAAVRKLDPFFNQFNFASLFHNQNQMIELQKAFLEAGF
jgi:TolB-like protein/class 3 adenylate cyclase/cytochrome c-type biogenesis protein CcmH/NrfG